MTGIAGHHDGTGNRWRLMLWSAAAGILLIPLVAMQFTTEVVWDATDFVTMGAMLLIAGGAIELGVRVTRNPVYRAALGAGVVALFLLVWVELATGVF